MENIRPWDRIIGGEDGKSCQQSSFSPLSCDMFSLRYANPIAERGTQLNALELHKSHHLTLFTRCRLINYSSPLLNRLNRLSMLFNNGKRKCVTEKLFFGCLFCRWSFGLGALSRNIAIFEHRSAFTAVYVLRLLFCLLKGRSLVTLLFADIFLNVKICEFFYRKNLKNWRFFICRKF